jgi:hypothetical protein
VSGDTAMRRHGDGAQEGGAVSPDRGVPASDARPSAGVREESKPSQRTVWLVLARRKYSDSLYQVGTVTAETPEMAAMFAQSIYDEHPWIEMVVVPRASVKTVIAS